MAPPRRAPFYVSCADQHPLLYRLSDGRFQLMTPGVITPFMCGYEYVLIENALADHLLTLDLPRITIHKAVIYDPRQGRDYVTHQELRIERRFSQDQIEELELDGEFFLMSEIHVFVTAGLKERLDAPCFNYLKFSLGLDGWVASGVTNEQ